MEMLRRFFQLCKRNKRITTFLGKRSMHIKQKRTIALNNQRIFIIHRNG